MQRLHQLTPSLPKCSVSHSRGRPAFSSMPHSRVPPSLSRSSAVHSRHVCLTTTQFPCSSACPSGRGSGRGGGQRSRSFTHLLQATSCTTFDAMHAGLRLQQAGGGEGGRGRNLPLARQSTSRALRRWYQPRMQARRRGPVMIARNGYARSGDWFGKGTRRQLPRV